MKRIDQQKYDARRNHVKQNVSAQASSAGDVSSRSQFVIAPRSETHWNLSQSIYRPIMGFVGKLIVFILVRTLYRKRHAQAPIVWSLWTRACSPRGPETCRTGPCPFVAVEIESPWDTHHARQRNPLNQYTSDAWSTDEEIIPADQGCAFGARARR